MWQPRHGTQIVVVDADSLEVVSSEATDPWFQWHFGKGFVNQDGDIVLEVVRYEDFATNQQLQEIAAGAMQTPAIGQLWRLFVDPKTAVVRHQVCLIKEYCEFPQVAPHQSLATAPTFLSIQPPGQDNTGELFRAIARFDPDTAQVMVAEAGHDCYPAEPIYVPQAGETASGWLLTVVYNGREHCSEVWIYDSDRLLDDPLCRLQLPSVIPHSFHGTWQPR